MTYKLKCKAYLLFYIFVFFHYLPFVQTNFTADSKTLVSVVVYSRHGHRTPASRYPKDLLDIHWPVGPAQLLNTGKEMQFKLGQLLRNRYQGFLPEKYSEKNILIKASKEDRVIMSAAVTAAGLYPPIEEQIWKEDLLWQPIPIYQLPEYYCSSVLLGSCEKIWQLWDFFKQNSSYFQSEDTKKLYSYLKENAGFWDNYDDIVNTFYIYDTLLIQEQNNYTLPEWTKEVYPHKLKQFLFEIFTGFYEKDMIRLSIGGFFNDMMNYFKSFQNAHNNNLDLHLMKLYFAHDTNLNQILYAINNWEDHIIEYGATVIFELHKINGQFYIQTYYLKNLSNIVLLEIEQGLTNYPLKDFDKMLSKYYVRTEEIWKEECKNYLNSNSGVRHCIFKKFYIFIVVNLILALNKFL